MVMIRISHGPANTDAEAIPNSDNPDPAGLSVSGPLVDMEISHQGRGSYDLVFFQDTADSPSPIHDVRFSPKGGWSTRKSLKPRLQEK